jgi:predicted RNA binding protein YcfA (HicA-like mRNA interferase family)
MNKTRIALAVAAVLGFLGFTLVVKKGSDAVVLETPAAVEETVPATTETEPVKDKTPGEMMHDAVK